MKTFAKYHALWNLEQLRFQLEGELLDLRIFLDNDKNGIELFGCCIADVTRSITLIQGVGADVGRRDGNKKGKDKVVAVCKDGDYLD
jgi:hypothetical protein